MAPGRGRGGKFSKPTRGGGKHFSRDLQPLDKDGNPKGMWRDPGEVESSEAESSSEEEESSEESESGVGSSKAAASAPGAELTREQRKEQARKSKMAAIARKNKKTAEVGDLPTSSSEEEDEGEDGLLANPNHSTKARAQARIATAPSGETPSPSRKEKDNLSRREREAIEKEAARERYQKLHAEGKTDEARADLARLRLIREEREAAAARKKAEQEEKAEELKARQEEIDEREKKLRAAALGENTPKGTKKTKGKK